MSSTTIRTGLQAIKSKTLNKPLPSPRRLMSFREWCDKVWEPSKRMREERWFPWGEKMFRGK